MRTETIQITVEAEDESQVQSFKRGLALWLSDLTVVRVLPGMLITHVELVGDWMPKPIREFER